VPNVVGAIKLIIVILNVPFIWAWGIEKLNVGKRMARAHSLVQIS
jgi:hypothetical protein